MSRGDSDGGEGRREGVNTVICGRVITPMMDDVKQRSVLFCESHEMLLAQCLILVITVNNLIRSIRCLMTGGGCGRGEVPSAARKGVYNCYIPRLLLSRLAAATTTKNAFFLPRATEVPGDFCLPIMA